MLSLTVVNLEDETQVTVIVANTKAATKCRRIDLHSFACDFLSPVSSSSLQVIFRDCFVISMFILLRLPIVA